MVNRGIKNRIYPTSVIALEEAQNDPEIDADTDADTDF